MRPSKVLIIGLNGTHRELPSFMDGLPVKDVFKDGSPPARRPVVVGAKRGLREEVRRRARRAKLKLRGS